MVRPGCLIASVLLVAAVTGARAQALTVIRVHANRVSFFYNRFVVEAQGDVDVRTSDGMDIRGDAFSMDLKLNRFLVAGNVRLRTRVASLQGAALSDFLDFNRIYFLPVTTEPDRWTFLNGDFSHPVPGRIMPGDTFFFANDGGGEPNFTARSAVIGAGSYVRLTGNVESDVFGVWVPLPPFYVSFAPTPALARNSLSGADADLTYQFAGNANSISALHLRYDPTNHVYASFEQHLAGEHEYAVFSLNPGTAPAKFWNLFTGDTMGNRFQINTFTQLYTYQYGFGRPRASAQYTILQATQALPHWSIQATSLLTNFNLLGVVGSNGLPNGEMVGEFNHPSQLQLTASSDPVRIFGAPLEEQLEFGAGFNHDSYGLQDYGGVEYTTIWDQLAGFTISLPRLQFGNRDSLYDHYVFSGSFSKQREWYSLPHHVDTTNFNATISRQFTRSVLAYTGYAVLNTGDYYLHGGYSVSSPLVNGVYDPGFESFKGVSTERIFSFAIDYAPSPEFTTSLLFQHHDDFPKPVPGVFPLPLLNPLGQFIYSNWLGQPPNQLTPEIHVKVTPHLGLTVAQTYYFGYPTLKWSPSTLVLLTPQ
ncbi:MAG: hypothetical protein ACREMP_06170 [Candidatus Tyrphobacter sp.]